MPKPGTLIFLVLLIIFVAAAWYVVQDGIRITSCFETNTQTFDDIEYGSRNQGWSQRRICELKFQAVTATESCLRDVASGSMLPDGSTDRIVRAMHLYRADIDETENLKDRHDEECFQYPESMFYPPDY
ncbi:hypothetical protein A2Z33_06870 [Candidatus Gottesmanbacteria bacterium RBG_16_52_11]|uniref:Uncharacterized protein n=1 Tax=Candidatus Gottesmanbacteria bacterium RBG_16_52_11 TaxID=1798374 RepID=A0A1F5YXX2_9BACT|nr:MAG: hypothetical protein A2Z33_06870 [Candidatus Gottesmanbacteria bacterium RBG_16_52_11]